MTEKGGNEGKVGRGRKKRRKRKKEWKARTKDIAEEVLRAETTDF